jgi:hypothetical protein
MSGPETLSHAATTSGAGELTGPETASGPEAPQTPGGQAGQPPFSYTQEFLCMFGDSDEAGPFGPRYHIVEGWRIGGRVDAGVLSQALDDVVARHEALRTSISHGDAGWSQRISPPCTAELLIKDLSAASQASRDHVAEEFLNEIESGPRSVKQLPHVRAVLGRFDDQDSVLALLGHHSAADGWSIRVIMRDLAACYAARARGGAPELPFAPQYREYAAWQKANFTHDMVSTSRDYWRDKLRHGQMLAVSTDRQRPAPVPRATSVYRFLIDAELTSATLKLARFTRGSAFMILLAAYNVLMRNLTGVTDVIVPTITSGRVYAKYENTVGPFFNFIPLRTDLAECGTLRDVVARSRKTCIEAQAHEIPFAHIVGEAPDLMTPLGDNSVAVCALQVFQNPFVMNGTVVGDLKYSEIRRRLLSQPLGSDIPNGALWTLEINECGEIYGAVRFDSNEFEGSTIASMVDEFRRILRDIVTAPDSPCEAP